MTHLRRHLEQTGTLAADQLDAALRRQQIYGGSLDTVLLELEIIDPHSLNELLQQACGLEIVPVDLLEDGVERPDDVLPEELVSIGWAVPLTVIDDRIHVAVHPDLPNERLGALYRTVPGVVPMVTPECALEKMAAELTRSVVPQRYAILCASYISTLRRRPSVSDAGIPLIPAERPYEDTQRTLTPFEPSAPAAREHAMNPRRTQFYRRSDIDQAIAATRMGVPQPVQTGDTQITRIGDPPAPEIAPAVPHADAVSTAPAEPSEAPRSTAPVTEVVDTGAPVPDAPVPSAVQDREPPLSPPPVTVPPVRFPARAAAADPEAKPPTPLQSTFEALERAETRDAVVAALVRGAMLVSARVGLFRVKGNLLQGMSTPRSALPDLGSTTTAVTDGSDLQRAVRSEVWSGTTADVALRNAVGVQAIVPCMTLRIDVAARPTLLLYLDHGGREFKTVDKDNLRDLVTHASEAFERLIKARRAAVAGTEAEAIPVAIIPPVVAARTEAAGEIEPPPTFGTTEPARWGPVPPEIDADQDEPRPIASPLEEPRRPRRVTQIDGSGRADEGAPSETDDRPTVQVTPPVQPQPADADADAPDPDRAPGIIPLSTPIDHGSVRGRISLDEEDIARPTVAPDEVDLERIDRAIDAAARRGGDVEALRHFGEAGLARLAALFPGPLEVLRRDLRALPPPSAHGPYIRLAIRLSTPVVPHVLDLFPHPDPDVRFYAAFVFQELRDHRCMTGLAKLAFDGSGDVRVIAMRVLETYSRIAGFDAAVAFVRQELEGGNRTRQLYAARAVGTLRDVVAIPELIELLSSSDRFIQEAALESLCSVTGQQHGLKPHRWRTWFSEHGGMHRIEWIIQSLRHRDLPVRRWAHDELIRVTGHRIPFSPLGDKKARDVAVDSWREWWENTGRGRFQGPTSAGYTG